MTPEEIAQYEAMVDGTVPTPDEGQQNVFNQQIANVVAYAMQSMANIASSSALAAFLARDMCKLECWSNGEQDGDVTRIKKCDLVLHENGELIVSALLIVEHEGSVDTIRQPMINVSPNPESLTEVRGMLEREGWTLDKDVVESAIFAAKELQPADK